MVHLRDGLYASTTIYLHVSATIRSDGIKGSIGIQVSFPSTTLSVNKGKNLGIA